MLQSFPPLCSGELALGEGSLNGISTIFTFLFHLTPMLMKKRELSCRSQTVKISPGEVISYPVGCPLFYNAALLLKEKQQREPGVVRKWLLSRQGDGHLELNWE